MKFLKVSNIKLNIDDSIDIAYKKAINIVGITENNVVDKKILKLSIDSRKQNEIHKVVSVGLSVKKYNNRRKNVIVCDAPPQYSYIPSGNEELHHRPVIVGFGPAGMFCAYLLAINGYKPIIIERGSRVEERIQKIEKFWDTGKLDSECNVQFGEGGAGTFSDGKLNTGIKDNCNRINFVLETFVKFGGKENILYDSKPHIGTDILAQIVINMRKDIELNGGSFYFDTALTDINISDNKVTSVVLSSGEIIETDICVLAIGHSARDTFRKIYELGIPMEQKPFAVGVRVEHDQKTINKSQYGFEDNRIGAASYKLTYKASNNRGVYSFCMCPGGFVVNSSSEPEHTVVNGMSYNDRAGSNANSAIVVTVTPDDFPTDHPLAGIEFQRTIEHKAYIEAKGAIPIQKYKDFKNKNVTDSLGNITPSVKGKICYADINNILPDYVCDSIQEGMEHFGKVIEGFNSDDVILSAVESRTSSPVRILRNDCFQTNVSGLYPAGEGAGYAGGITSAAIDGMKIFEYIGHRFKPF